VSVAGVWTKVSRQWWLNNKRETYLLEYSLLELPRSWDGEPAPDRALEAMRTDELTAPGRPKGDLAEPESMGELFVDGDAERVWFAECEE
jgi:hypothetical protein